MLLVDSHYKCIDRRLLCAKLFHQKRGWSCVGGWGFEKGVVEWLVNSRTQSKVTIKCNFYVEKIKVIYAETH